MIYHIEFLIHISAIKRKNVDDSIEVTNKDVDEIFDKVYNFYTKDDLNNEIVGKIRNKNINKITE
jgi:hypothetical protein